MSRTRLPERRPAATAIVRHTSNNGVETDFVVTFGFGIEEELHIRECFCSTGAKSGTDMAAILSDSCIAISLLLQHGMSISEIAHAFGEDRPEGAAHGPPSSVLGSIARAGVALERSLALIEPS